MGAAAFEIEIFDTVPHSDIQPRRVHRAQAGRQNCSDVDAYPVVCAFIVIEKNSVLPGSKFLRGLETDLHRVRFQSRDIMLHNGKGGAECISGKISPAKSPLPGKPV